MDQKSNGHRRESQVEALNTSYTLNSQDSRDEMLFFINKMVRPETHTGLSYIKTKLYTMNMSQFKHDVSNAKIHIMEWMNEISIYGDTYSKIVRKKFNL